MTRKKSIYETILTRKYGEGPITKRKNAAPDLIETIYSIEQALDPKDNHDAAWYFNEFALRYKSKPYKNASRHHKTLLYQRFLRKTYGIIQK